MLVAWLEIGNRTLEPIEDCCPKFHTVQVCSQSLERLDQISHDRIGRLFRHFTNWSYQELKTLVGLWFPTRPLRNASIRIGLDATALATRRPLFYRSGSNFPALTSTTAAFAVIS